MSNIPTPHSQSDPPYDRYSDPNFLEAKYGGILTASSMMNEIAFLRRQNDELRDAIVRVSVHPDGIRLADIDASHKAMVQRLNEIGADNISLRETITILEKDNQKLRNELRELSEANARISDENTRLIDSNAVIRSDNANLSTLVGNLSKQLASVMERMDEVEKKMDCRNE